MRKSPNETIDKLAETLPKDPAAAKKQAGELARKVDTDDLMGVLNKRDKDGGGGFGFGPKATGEKDDSIEKKVENLGDLLIPLSDKELAEGVGGSPETDPARRRRRPHRCRQAGSQDGRSEGCAREGSQEMG